MSSSKTVSDAQALVKSDPTQAEAILRSIVSRPAGEHPPALRKLSKW